MEKVHVSHPEGSKSTEVDQQTLRAAIQCYLLARDRGEPATRLVQATFGFSEEEFRPYADQLSQFLRSEQPPRPARLDPGICLGKYCIVQQLGGGAHGEVYSAIDQSLGCRSVAIKVCSVESDEPHILARLRHPNLPTVIDHFHDETLDLHVQVMEFRGVQSAADYLSAIDHRSRRCEAVRIVAEIASAIEYLHSKGIIHCDIKPANIVIDTQGIPTLVDFSSARHLLSLSSPAVTMGFTPDHLLDMPPSLFVNEITTGFDVFSLALTLLHLVSLDDAPDALADLLTTSESVGTPLSRPLARIISQIVSHARRGTDVSFLMQPLRFQLAEELRRTRSRQFPIRSALSVAATIGIVGILGYGLAFWQTRDLMTSMPLPMFSMAPAELSPRAPEMDPAGASEESPGQRVESPIASPESVVSDTMKRVQVLVRDQRLRDAIEVIDEALGKQPNIFSLVRARCGFELAIVSVEGGAPTIEYFERMLEIGGDEVSGQNLFDAGIAFAFAAAGATDETEQARLISRSRELFAESRQRGVDLELARRRKGLHQVMKEFPELRSVAVGDKVEIVEISK